MGFGMEKNPCTAENSFGQRQAEPIASSHPVFQSRQHAFRPYRGFNPAPASMGLFGLRSPLGH